MSQYVNKSFGNQTFPPNDYRPPMYGSSRNVNSSQYLTNQIAPFRTMNPRPPMESVPGMPEVYRRQMGADIIYLQESQQHMMYGSENPFFHQQEINYQFQHQNQQMYPSIQEEEDILQLQQSQRFPKVKLNYMSPDLQMIPRNENVNPPNIGEYEGRLQSHTNFQENSPFTSYNMKNLQQPPGFSGHKSYTPATRGIQQRRQYPTPSELSKDSNEPPSKIRISNHPAKCDENFPQYDTRRSQGPAISFPYSDNSDYYQQSFQQRQGIYSSNQRLFTPRLESHNAAITRAGPLTPLPNQLENNISYTSTVKEPPVTPKVNDESSVAKQIHEVSASKSSNQTDNTPSQIQNQQEINRGLRVLTGNVDQVLQWGRGVSEEDRPNILYQIYGLLDAITKVSHPCGRLITLRSLEGSSSMQGVLWVIDRPFNPIPLGTQVCITGRLGPRPSSSATNKPLPRFLVLCVNAIEAGHIPFYKRISFVCQRAVQQIMQESVPSSSDTKNPVPPVKKSTTPPPMRRTPLHQTLISDYTPRFMKTPQIN